MRHILLVDDDRHICLAISAWPKQCGFRVAAPLIAISGHAFAGAESRAAASPARWKKTRASTDDRRYLHAAYARL
jgi:hypothetical protein